MPNLGIVCLLEYAKCLALASNASVYGFFAQPFNLMLTAIVLPLSEVECDAGWVIMNSIGVKFHVLAAAKN